MKHLLKPGANELLVQTRQANILLLLFGRTTFCLLTPRSKCFCLSRISHLRGSRVPVCTFLHALIFTQSLSEKETNLMSSAFRILLVQNVDQLSLLEDIQVSVSVHTCAHNFAGFQLKIYSPQLYTLQMLSIHLLPEQKESAE